MEDILLSNLEIVISLLGTIVGLIFALLAYLRNAKAKKSLQCEVKITNALIPYMSDAERFTAFTGEQKKVYVMTKANQFAIDNKIKFNAEKISAKVEELLLLTKHVNSKNIPAERMEQPITFRNDQVSITKSYDNNNLHINPAHSNAQDFRTSGANSINVNKASGSLNIRTKDIIDSWFNTKGEYNGN